MHRSDDEISKKISKLHSQVLGLTSALDEAILNEDRHAYDIASAQAQALSNALTAYSAVENWVEGAPRVSFPQDLAARAAVALAAVADRDRPSLYLPVEAVRYAVGVEQFVLNNKAADAKFLEARRGKVMKREKMQEAVQSLVTAIGQFYYDTFDIGPDQNVPHCALELEEAMRELAEGHTAPLFRPVKRKGGTITNSSELVIMGTAAAAVDAGKRCLGTYKASATEICRILRSKGYSKTSSGRAITATTLINWRNAVVGHAERYPDKQAFDGWVNQFPPEDGGHEKWLAMFNAICDALRRQVPKTRPLADSEI